MSTLPDFTGPGFFAGEAPDGLTTIAGTPTSAQVRVYWRDPADSDAPDVLVASTQSAADGTWQIAGLNPALRYVVRAQKSQFDDVTVVGAAPSRTDVIACVNQLVPREDEFGDVDGLTGYVLLDSGLPPFTCQVIEPLPFGLTARVDGRKLLIDGASEDVGDWESVVRVTASNGVWGDVPVQMQIHVVSDPYFANVIALLKFEDGIIDATGRVWTVRGSQAIVRSESALVGEKGLRIDGLDSSVDTTTQLDISGAMPVTIEGFMRIASYTGPKMPSANVYRQSIFGQSGNFGSRDQYIAIDSGKVVLYRDSAYSGGSVINAKGVNLVPLNEKFHFEYSFDGTRARVFINGVKEIDVASANGWANTGYPFRIGAAYNVGYPQYRAGANADFDEIRITAGVARHTDNFTPPSGPFPGR